ncbi:DUF2958 domain-containing protein [Sphingomonas sp. WKB10]|nr:DUF2958 domain-containing protein [Sphingomonas sp. WKB10]
MDFLKMIRPEDVQQLVMNWQEQQPLKGTSQEKDYMPIKLFNPAGAGTWLVTELEPNSSLAFGLCDLGMGEPELGYVCLEELWDLRLPAGLKIEQDLHWKASKPLSEYASESRRLGYIRA